jgi:hypothetical protein
LHSVPEEEEPAEKEETPVRGCNEDGGNKGVAVTKTVETRAIEITSDRSKVPIF